MRPLRGIGVRQVRITCGLVMFSYLLSHFSNHALGNVSYWAMEAGLRYHIAWWRNPVVATILYTAAITHWSLGLWALYERRHFRYAFREIAQLVLGLSIPFWLVIHFAGARLSGTLFGRQIYYGHALYSYWVTRPHMEAVQFTLLLIAWTHACIGLYFWLRLKPFFRWAAPFLLAGAVLLPALAILGVVHGARELVSLANAAWRAEYLSPRYVGTPDQRAILDAIIFYFPFAYTGVLALVFAARGVRAWRERRGGLVKLAYPDGQVVSVPKGLSVLEASLRYRIPHASVCGGKARCSTCRIRVLGRPDDLPAPSRRESFVLERVGVSADPAIRLACQLRPESDLAFALLLPPQLDSSFVRGRRRIHIGEERYIVSMFVDMRGSTRLAEHRLPFDTVFVINRFLAVVSQAVVGAGGQPNQFIGDGLLALFGLDVDAATACHQAIRAAAAISAGVARLNGEMAADLAEPIGFGIGVHAGVVILGDIGYRDHTVFTALGDAVNVAARLQDLTKTLECELIVSEEVFEKSGIASETMPAREITVRGRSEMLLVRTATQVVLTSAAFVLTETAPRSRGAGQKAPAVRAP